MAQGCASSALSPEVICWFAGVDMFCIFPTKILQMESCHPGKWVCDLYPPLALSEWWKVKMRNFLSSWRTCSSSQHWPVKQTIHLSTAVPSALSKISWELVQKQFIYISDLQKCSNSYLDSVFQSVAFALQRIGFDVMCIADCHDS